MYEAVMVGHDHQPPHNLAAISCTPISSSFEEKLEHDRVPALPARPESRPLRTVRGPSTPAADAAHLSVAARRIARCRQPPERD